MKGTCIMGTPDDIQILFGKIDSLVDVSGKTNISIEGMRGDMKVLGEQMKHKVEGPDITRDIELHKIECNTRNTKGGLWDGMTAGQKTAALAGVVTAIGSVVVNIIQNV